MRIAIATVQVPFIYGGAELMTNQLKIALNEHGYVSELVSMPFRFSPHNAVRECMNEWEAKYFNSFDCGSIDKVICLKFPSFYLNHPNKTVWLMHQHRSVYELFETPYGESSKNQGANSFRSEIMRRDTKALLTADKIFTISNRVSERMSLYNGIQSKPIYQPPPNAELFFCDEQLDYIFCPSRLEELKRQELLIRSMANCKSPVAAIIAGEGGIRPELEALVKELNLQSRVRFIGRVNDHEMRLWYANSLGIFFGPYDEDYGFITLEAMLSSKPVITCSDSGGPLDFVVKGETGFVVDADPNQITHAIEMLFKDKRRARQMGLEGFAHYQKLNISWSDVIEKLMG